ncbi:unnamed protein product [Adineta ricciae]|uniref:Uncharacterized protein n=1 Tax=Adineta ricciae TaxID=249248 RepID=A0A815F790_ADIRI|nr:unnamed protein product [Adineta ricciae]CAF1447649.1 unnamed protein product [Adineta ricciae]
MNETKNQATEQIPQQLQREVLKKKKKKSRGHRRLQRFHRKLREQCIQLSINEELSAANVNMKPKESTITKSIVDGTTLSMEILLSYWFDKEYLAWSSKSLIEQRLKQIQKHMETTKSAIEQFEHDILLKCDNTDDCIYAMKELYLILSQLVQEKQQIILARRIWKAAKEQLIVKQEIALLQYRLLSTSFQYKSVSNLVHEMIDNIGTNIKTLNETVEMSSSNDCLSNEIERLKSSKNDIIYHAILTLDKKLEI